jgi:hypothetical protein
MPDTHTPEPPKNPKVVPPWNDEILNIKIESIDDPEDGNIVFTAVSSNHKSNFSAADTCCTCTS